MTLASARKALVAVLGAAVVVLTSLGVVVPDGVSDSAVDVFDSVVVLLTALGVFAVPND